MGDGTLFESSSPGNSTPILCIFLSSRDCWPQLEPVFMLGIALCLFAKLQAKFVSPSLQGFKVCSLEGISVAFILVPQYNVKAYLLDPLNVLSLHCGYGTMPGWDCEFQYASALLGEDIN